MTHYLINTLYINMLAHVGCQLIILLVLKRIGILRCESLE